MSELPHKAEDKTNVFGIVMVGVVSSILVWVSVVLLVAYYDNTAGSLELERDAANKSREVETLKQQQLIALADSKYVDAKRGLVTIPLEDAMQVVLRDAKSGADSLVPAIGPHNVTPDDAPSFPGGPAPDPNAATGGAEGEGAEGGEGEGEGAGAGAGADDAAATGQPTGGATERPTGGQSAPANPQPEPGQGGDDAPSEAESDNP